MRILALDAAMQRCSAAIVEDGRALAHLRSEAGRGQHHLLPLMARQAIDEAGGFDAVAVCVGPGSFTGLRASLALAHGLSGGEKPLAGVTVAEALAELAGDVGDRPLWTAIDSRRGRIFLDRDGRIAAIDIIDVAPPPFPIAICGDAAAELAATLLARGANVLLTAARQPDALAVAAVGAERLSGALPALDAQPLYIDPPEAKLPAGGLRPPPA
jgi:tRNA threonylcarbamoyladenosine biosynthesis protein TsaB